MEYSFSFYLVLKEVTPDKARHLAELLSELLPERDYPIGEYNEDEQTYVISHNNCYLHGFALAYTLQRYLIAFNLNTPIVWSQAHHTDPLYVESENVYGGSAYAVTQFSIRSINTLGWCFSRQEKRDE